MNGFHTSFEFFHFFGPHQIHMNVLGNLEFYITNSASCPLTIKAIVSPDGGSNYFDNVNGKLVTSSGGAINVTQEDLINPGVKFFKLQVTNNHGGGTSTNVTINVAYYK
jgi:hypothetical protein